MLRPDYLWRGYHPFGEMTSLADVIGQFWMPLKSSLTRLQRREDVFFAGKNVTENNDGTWVVSMGHLMGTVRCAVAGYSTDP
jgi:hypothetical protein